MAVISKPVETSPWPVYLRAFDPRRDLAPVADLIELCFNDTLEEDGARYLRHLREAAQNINLLRWAPMASEWSGVPMAGYIWEQEGSLVGNASLIPYRAQSQKNYLIANVAVHPDYRRQGIARWLTLRAVEEVRQRGASSVWLHVREENDGAVTLYQSLGFLERARRTSWHHPGDFLRQPLRQITTDTGLIIGPRHAHHWEQQRRWLLRNYPPDLSWSQPISLNALRPGLWGALGRLFGNLYIQQWSLERDRRLQAVLSWYSTWGKANLLWLAAPFEADPQAVQALLLHAGRYVPSHRPLALEYPSHQHIEAIRGAGFVEKQTLIWMEKKLN